ncbi:MAG TPA: hypothetical protein VJC21_00720 [Candidatus Nanoarchaeia archaeon]|nr:hypothetical protein [Candidatus Nanoarchaeia archaeon]
MALPKGITLSQKAVDTALGEALRTSDEEQEWSSYEMNQSAMETPSSPIEQLERELSGVDAPAAAREENTSLDNLLEAVEELDPNAKQRFIDALTAQQYGVKRNTAQRSELVPYGDIIDEVAKARTLVTELGGKIAAYRNVLPYEQSDRKRLKTLAEAAILYEQDTRIYLAALKRADGMLNKDSLKNKENEAASRRWTIGGVIMGGYNGLTLAVGLAIGTPLLLTGSLFFSVFHVLDLLTNESSDEQTYQTAIARYAKKKEKEFAELPQHLDVALNYAQKMQEQLQKPQKVSKDYARRTVELWDAVDYGKKYFSAAIPLLERLNK